VGLPARELGDQTRREGENGKGKILKKMKDKNERK